MRRTESVEPGELRKVVIIREIAGLHSCARVADPAPRPCLTESMINTLSKVHNLFVIARNSTFTYKDRPVRYSRWLKSWGLLDGSA
jgi:hypothetical protein